MPLHLLLIDSDPAGCELVREILVQAEATVSVGANAAESERLIEQQQYEGVFLRFDGQGDAESLARKIRRSTGNRTTPIVMIARKSDSETVRKGFAAGATFLLPEPVTREEVLAVLRKSRSTMMEEKRRHQRVPVRSSITLFLENESRVAEVLDLSESGMAVRLEAPLAVGARVRTAFQLTPARAIDADMVLRSIRGDRMGLEFSRISSEDRQAIRDHVKAILAD